MSSRSVTSHQARARAFSTARDLHMRPQVDEQIHACYAQTMSEWLGCEAIVRQRERESHAAALAKCSSGASLDSHLHRMLHRDSTISNEVSNSWPGGTLVGGARALGQPAPSAFEGRGSFGIRSRFKSHPESLVLLYSGSGGGLGIALRRQRVSGSTVASASVYSNTVY